VVYSLYYRYKQVLNDTIQEEDSIIFDTSLIDITAKEINFDEIERMFRETIHKQADPQPEDLKAAYKEKRIRGRK